MEAPFGRAATHTEQVAAARLERRAAGIGGRGRRRRAEAAGQRSGSPRSRPASEAPRDGVGSPPPVRRAASAMPSRTAADSVPASELAVSALEEAASELEEAVSAAELRQRLADMTRQAADEAKARKAAEARAAAAEGRLRGQPGSGGGVDLAPGGFGLASPVRRYVGFLLTEYAQHRRRQEARRALTHWQAWIRAAKGAEILLRHRLVRCHREMLREWRRYTAHHVAVRADVDRKLSREVEKVVSAYQIALHHRARAKARTQGAQGGRASPPAAATLSPLQAEQKEAEAARMQQLEARAAHAQELQQAAQVTRPLGARLFSPNCGLRSSHPMVLWSRRGG